MILHFLKWVWIQYLFIEGIKVAMFPFTFVILLGLSLYLVRLNQKPKVK